MKPRHLRRPKRVVIEVGRNGQYLLEEHTCFSQRDALRLCEKNWPLATDFTLIAEEYA